MFEILIWILAMAAIMYTGFDIINKIYTKETVTDLDKWQADHADILTSKRMGEWLAKRDKRIEEGIKAAINEKCREQGGPIDLCESLAIIERFLGGYKK